MKIRHEAVRLNLEEIYTQKIETEAARMVAIIPKNKHRPTQLLLWNWYDWIIAIALSGLSWLVIIPTFSLEAKGFEMLFYPPILYLFLQLYIPEYYITVLQLILKVFKYAFMQKDYVMVQRGKRNGRNRRI
ncbi:MAG: hypothetical protein RR443_03860 [Anaerorhabdus sp.]